MNFKQKSFPIAFSPPNSDALFHRSGKFFVKTFAELPENVHPKTIKGKLHQKNMETGHNKNVANFETVIIILTNLGAAYAPPQPLILLAALNQLLTDAKAAMTDVDAAQAAKTVAVDQAQAEFEDLGEYVVNIKRQAQVEVNDPAFTADLQTIVNKFSPPKRSTGLPDDPLTTDIDESRTAASQSQRSRDNQIAHLADISALLKTNANYKGAGTPYAVPEIDAKIAALTAANNALKTADAAFGTKLDARDSILYNNETGIIPRIKLIKTYITLKFGEGSSTYEQIKALEFKKR